MILLDSYGWLEVFTGREKADQYAYLLQQDDVVLVPVVCTYEVFNVSYRERGEESAIICMGMMRQHQEVGLSESLAFHAALLSDLHKLPMADAMVKATAEVYSAMVYTHDAHFKGLRGVSFIE